MVGKRRQTQTSKFFLVLTCLSAGSNAPFGVPPKFGARQLSSPYFFMACDLLTSYLITSRHSLSKKNESRTLTSSSHIGNRNIRFRSHMHTRTLDLQSSQVILTITNTSSFQFGDYCLIYLFIHSILYEPFNYITDCDDLMMVIWC